MISANILCRPGAWPSTCSNPGHFAAWSENWFHAATLDGLCGKPFQFWSFTFTRQHAGCKSLGYISINLHNCVSFDHLAPWHHLSSNICHSLLKVICEAGPSITCAKMRCSCWNAFSTRNYFFFSNGFWNFTRLFFIKCFLIWIPLM